MSNEKETVLLDKGISNLFNQMSHYLMGSTPIWARMIERFGWVEKLDSWGYDERVKLTPGVRIKALLINILTDRRSLYRIKEFYEQRDLEVLFGPGVSAEDFNDDALGRALDWLSEIGIDTLYPQLAAAVLREIGDLPLAGDWLGVHADTTSVSVTGQYEPSEEDDEDTLRLARGYSKDKRPDLKQFLFGLATIKGLPVHGTVEDGNLADPKWNGQLIPKLREALAEAVPQHKPIYIADAAAVNEDNLRAFDEQRVSFISRLPSTYKLCEYVKEAAWHKPDAWQDIGVLAEDADGSSYRLQAFRRELHGRTYRFLVVHSTSLEALKRRKWDDVVAREYAKWSKDAQRAGRTAFACRKDAERAAEAFEKAHRSGLHTVQTAIAEESQAAKRTGRGRPPKEAPAPPSQTVYRLHLTIVAPSAEAQAHFLHQEASFVLLTDIRDDQRLPDAQVLRLYKEQHEVEGRFRFLKSPYFVGPVYLHTPRRVEAFAYVMLLALLLYSAFEHVIRTKMKHEQEPLILPGDRKSWKPTGSSVMDLFEAVLTSAVEIGGQVHRGISSRPNPQLARVLGFLGWDAGIYTESASKA